MTIGSRSVTVITPTFNRRDRLHRVLTSLVAQDVGTPFEVVVVSDGSSDGTNEYLAGPDVPLPVVAVYQSPNEGPAAARNAGVDRASGDLVVFVDDDVVAHPALIRMHCEAHDRLGETSVVVGPMLTPEDHDMSAWIHWEQRMLDKQYTAMNDGAFAATARQFYTGNASVRVDHVRRVGGFDTTFKRAEDVELAYRLDDLGLTFHFEPGAIGYHYAERTFESWHGAAHLYGRNDVVFARDRGREWILDFIGDAYRRHHPLVRASILTSMRSRPIGALGATVLRRIALDDRLDAGGRVRQAALSGLYAIAYNRGVADELGSPDRFRELVRRPHSGAP